MRFCFVVLALPALAFKPACRASSATSSLSRTTTSEIHRSSSSHALESAARPLSMLNFKTKFFSMIGDRFKSTSELFESLKLLDKDIASTIAAMRTDYREIKAFSGFCSAVSMFITDCLMHLPPDLVSQIGSTEAFNYVVMLMAFVPANGRTANEYSAIQTLSRRIASERWSELSDWAIYVANHHAYMMPMQLFDLLCFPADRILANCQDICDVIVCGRAFEKNGFYRPEREAPEPNGIDSRYTFRPIPYLTWSGVTVKRNEKFLEIFFRLLKCSTKFPIQMLSYAIPCLCKIISQLDSDSSLVVLAIEALISDIILKRLVFPDEELSDEHCAGKIILMALETDETALKRALNSLSMVKAFVTEQVVEIKRSMKKDSIFTKIYMQLKLLNESLLADDRSEFVNGISTILELIKHHPPAWETSSEEMAQSLQVDVLLYNFDMQWSASCAFRYDDKCHLLLVRYLLSGLEKRLDPAMELIFLLGSTACEEYNRIFKPTDFESLEKTMLKTNQLHELILTYLPEEHMFDAFSDACECIKARNQFSLEEFKEVAFLATVAFEDTELANFIADLSTIRLLNGGVLENDYLDERFFSVQTVRPAICMAVLAEWHTIRSTWSASANAAFEVFARWVIMNNLVPRSMDLIISAVCG